LHEYAIATRGYLTMPAQNTSHILMIRPVAFAMNAETATDNHYQQQVKGLSSASAQEQALNEFDGFVGNLRRSGVHVTVVEDTLNPPTPDSIFPNNWVSFHETGMVVLYPMYAESRRAERRDDIIETLKTEGFKIKETLDYSGSEDDGFFLEGTGSLVLDRENLIAYACMSQRTNDILLKDWGKQLGYEVVSFRSLQNMNGTMLPIYHTNVMMSVGQEIAIICAETIRDDTERNSVISSLERTGKVIVYITEVQKSSFAGNMLQVTNDQDERIMVMSTQAYESLTLEQITTIEKTNRILHSPLTTIETLGGGSARCMMAEVFLPRV